MDENSLFTPFDEITQTRELQMLKTIIPYMPHDSQKQMTLMVHYISLMNSMRMIDCAPALSVAETESMADRRLSMLNALKKYCSKSEQDTIDNLLNIFQFWTIGRFMTKQEFLNNFAQKEKPKDTTSAMPFLMESIKEAKRNGIEFTKEEVYSMCTELSKTCLRKTAGRLKGF